MNSSRICGSSFGRTLDVDRSGANRLSSIDRIRYPSVCTLLNRLEKRRRCPKRIGFQENG